MDRKIVIVRHLIEAGFPVQKISRITGISQRRVSRIKREGKNTCNQCRRRMFSELSPGERKRLVELLRFVPPHAVSRWLQICFRERRCSRGVI